MQTHCTCPDNADVGMVLLFISAFINQQLREHNET